MKKAAHLIRENNTEIIDLWEKRVKSNIHASHQAQSLVLRNQLPHVLVDIAEIMEKYDDFQEVREDEKFQEIISNSLDHGRHRATTSNYTIAGILEEYLIFHQVLTDFLQKNEAYTTNTGILLKYTIETAMIKSSSSFNQSINDMKEKLVGTLAHDIRNPIAAASMALELLDVNEGAERLDTVKNMATRSLDHSLKLIEGLLDAITVEAGEGISLNFEELDIYKDIEWVVNEARLIFSNKIQFKSNSAEIPGVFDGTAVRRVLENLLTNAVKYGKHSSIIEVCVDDDSEKVTITVHNNGDPIPEDKQTEIFEYLNSNPAENKSGLKSWGMGLSLVKTVAEAHGGEVNVKSTIEKGTEFTIVLMKQANAPGKTKSRIKGRDKD